jgi:uncharacterized repeat protein (TIGR03806 family)
MSRHFNLVKYMLITCRPGQLFAALVLASGACSIDEPVLISPRGGGPPAERLSELGIFLGDVALQEPSAGVVPYEVLAPLWSDGASKLRFIWLPAGQKLGYGQDWWTVPAGTWLVKTFYFPRDAREPGRGRRLLETRVMAFEQGGVARATYVWNEAQTEAFASGGQIDLPVEWMDLQGASHAQTHHVPGTSQCGWCHGASDRSRGLGLRTWEMNVDRSFADGTTNQLEHLVAAGVLDQTDGVPERVSDPYGEGPLPERAITYLRANCASCHRREGYAKGSGVFFESAEAIAATVCRSTKNVDGRDRVIVPGEPEASALVARMLSTDPYRHMPQGPIHIPDPDGIALLRAWIAGLAPVGCP